MLNPPSPKKRGLGKRNNEDITGQRKQFKALLYLRNACEAKIWLENVLDFLKLKLGSGEVNKILDKTCAVDDLDSLPCSSYLAHMLSNGVILCTLFNVIALLHQPSAAIAHFNKLPKNAFQKRENLQLLIDHSLQLGFAGFSPFDPQRFIVHAPGNLSSPHRGTTDEWKKDIAPPVLNWLKGFTSFCVKFDDSAEFAAVTWPEVDEEQLELKGNLEDASYVADLLSLYEEIMKKQDEKPARPSRSSPRRPLFPPSSTQSQSRSQPSSPSPSPSPSTEKPAEITRQVSFSEKVSEIEANSTQLPGDSLSAENPLSVPFPTSSRSPSPPPCKSDSPAPTPPQSNSHQPTLLPPFQPYDPTSSPTTPRVAALRRGRPEAEDRTEDFTESETESDREFANAPTPAEPSPLAREAVGPRVAGAGEQIGERKVGESVSANETGETSLEELEEKVEEEDDGEDEITLRLDEIDIAQINSAKTESLIAKLAALRPHSTTDIEEVVGALEAEFDELGQALNALSTTTLEGESAEGGESELSDVEMRPVTVLDSGAPHALTGPNIDKGPYLNEDSPISTPELAHLKKHFGTNGPLLETELDPFATEPTHSAEDALAHPLQPSPSSENSLFGESNEASSFSSFQVILLLQAGLLATLLGVSLLSSWGSYERCT